MRTIIPVTHPARTLIEASEGLPLFAGSKDSNRLNSKEQIGTRTKKRNKSGKKKGKIYVNVNNKVGKPHEVKRSLVWLNWPNPAEPGKTQGEIATTTLQQ